jgi:hypothetical protein
MSLGAVLGCSSAAVMLLAATACDGRGQSPDGNLQATVTKTRLATSIPSPTAKPTRTWPVETRTGVVLVDRVLDMETGASGLREGDLLEPVLVPCEGLPPPGRLRSGPDCGDLLEGTPVPAIRFGRNCSTPWEAVEPGRLSGFNDPSPPYRRPFAVQRVQRDFGEPLGFVSFVVFLVEVSDMPERLPTTRLELGATGIKLISSACGRRPEEAIPSGPDIDWLLPPP